MSNEKKQSEKDRLSGVETTGHEWDGLKELNNPAPRWWLWVLIVTIIWSIGYWVVYPAWPTLTGSTKGKFGWTQYSQLKMSQKEIAARQEKYLERVGGMTAEDIKKDPEMYEFALAGGAQAFKENCAACHGSGAEGRIGYPNLNDDDWIWGGSLASIEQSIRFGINSGHANQRGTQMPAFGRDAVLKSQEVEDVATYVIGLKDKDKVKKSDSFLRGEAIFAANCASCHGTFGEGNQEIGAPRLNDDIWMRSKSREAVYDMIINARPGIMPSWEGRLSDSTIKALAVYVHSLGGGK